MAGVVDKMTFKIPFQPKLLYESMTWQQGMRVQWFNDSYNIKIREYSLKSEIIQFITEKPKFC